MHILQLLPSLTVGGVERGVVDISKGLIARGHRVSVISSGGALVEPLARAGALHYQLPVHEKAPDTVWKSLPEVAQIIRSTGVDIVHARSRVPGWIGWMAARQTQKPFVTTAHGFYRPHLMSRVMAWGRLVIAPSDSLGRYLVEQFGLPKERLRIIPRGVDLQEFTFSEARREHAGAWRVGLIGRVSAIKGHAVALRALEQLARKKLSVKLIFAGDAGPSEAKAKLQRSIALLKLHDCVEWRGVEQDVSSLIASLDMVIVPSIYPESFGRGVIEAQAVGRPVVASRLGALEELIEEEQTGLLVAPNDPNALAGAIERFISDEGLRTRCTQQARKQVEEEWNVGRMVERTEAVYQECLYKPRVVVWKLSALGDVILSTPSLRAIRKQNPGAHISLVVGRAAYEAAARCPYLDEVIIYDPKKKDRGLSRQWAFIRRLQRAAFDVSIDLQNSRMTHLLAWLSGAWRRIGYSRKWGWCLNQGVRLPKVVLAPIAHQHYLLRESGIAADGDQLELWPSTQDEAAAEALLSRAAISSEPRGTPVAWVGLHPGGSHRWRTKRWDLSRWAKVCDALHRSGVRVVVVGGPEEQLLGEQLTQMTETLPLVIIGKTRLLELACVIRRCAVFLSHDSSSLHVASAMGTPAVALFGPTDPRRHLPPAFKGKVLQKKVFCSPCYSTRCKTLTHACMKQISVEEVLHAVHTLLAESESPAL